MLRIREERQNSGANVRFAATQTPPVIMQVVPALVSGGVEQGVVDMNAAIVGAGGTSIVVSSGGPRAHDITRHGGLHITCPVHSKNPATMMRNVGKLHKIIKEHNVQLVHACSRAPAWSAGRAAHKAGIRYITSCHAAHNVENGLKRFYNKGITKGERVIAVSHFLAEYLQNEYNVPHDKLRVIHRGISVEKFHPNGVTPDRLINVSKNWRIPDGAPVILLPARLTRGKGHAECIEAVAQLQNKDFFCVFVGKDKKGQFRPELEELINQKNMQGRIRIVEHCDDMPAAYMLSSVIVCPSTHPEGFGRIPIEAQAMGRPVIATDLGGFRESVRSGETGWLIPPNDVQTLSETIKIALSLDSRQRAVLATQAMSHVAQHFLNEKMCRETLAVYAEMLGISLTAQELGHIVPAKDQTERTAQHAHNHSPLAAGL